MRMRVQMLDPEMPLPAYLTEGAAGLDLRAARDAVVDHGSVELVPTGVAVEIPEGHFGLLCLRSSLGLMGLCMPNAPGIIDSDYRGEVKVPLISLRREQKVYLRRGERIAQLIILPYVRVSVEQAQELSQTKRGNGGFGSTGMG